MQKVLFICVIYNNYEETLEFINCVNDLNDSKLCDIVVVDNSIGKNKVFLLENFILNKKNIFIVKSSINLGYFGGMNLGVSYYISIKKELPRWIIISNTDIKFANKEFITELYNTNIGGNIVCIAPKILSSKTKMNQNPYMKNRPSLSKLNFLNFIYRSNISFTIYNYLYNIKESIKSKKNNVNNDKDCKNIYAPHGSFIILDKIFFKRGGTLDYGGFLYGEEIFLGEQIHNMGLEIKYNGKFVLHHNEHTTTSLLNKTESRIFRYNATKYLKEMMFLKKS